MKNKFLQFSIAIFFASVGYSQPPNNSIFFGSTGDGFTKNSNGITSNSIFLGGSGDGATILSNGIASNNIFSGGAGDGVTVSTNGILSNNIFGGGPGDGFNFSNNASVSNNIFTGGIGDGFNGSANNSVSNNIFVGGDGDGWNFDKNVSASNSIFLGGDGDGWSSVYRPQAPLPVTYEYFTAAKLNESAAILSWKTSQEINSAWFDVERSDDAINFVKIGRVLAAGNSSAPIKYDFTDYMPLRGMDYYRLKQVDKDGHFVYTPARLVSFDNLNAWFVKYYPNPTNGLLNIELSQSMRNEDKVINITTVSGVVINQIKVGVSSNILPLNLSKYPKGTYFIQVKTKTTNSTQRIILQ